MKSRKWVARLTKTMYAAGVLFLLSGLLLAAVNVPVQAQQEDPEDAAVGGGGSGAIWTTNEGCDNPAAQDDNAYSVGETVHIRGSNFNANTAVEWSISGQPGSATPGEIASGTGTTNADGYFCIAAHTIQPGEDGEYKVAVKVGRSNKTDNYQVDGFIANPGLTLDKTVGQETFSFVGEQIQYTYELTNSGNVALTGFSVNDDRIPVNCTGAAASLEPTASTTCVGTHTVTQADLDAGIIVNTATAYGSYNGNTVTSNPDSAQVTAVPYLELALDKSVNPDTYATVGSVLTYSYAITNNSNLTVSSLYVSDDKLGTVSCPAVDLAPGASITCTANYTIKLSDLLTGEILNVATAHGATAAGGVSSDPDDAKATANLNPSLWLEKTAIESSYDAPNQVLHYSYKLTNNGNVPLNGPFTVSDDHIPAVICPAQASLDVNAELFCEGEYIVTQDDLDAGSVHNWATAYASFGGESVTSNDDDATVTGSQSPALTIVKDVDEAYYQHAGEVLHYTYELTNIGNVTLNAGFSVTDDKAGDAVCPQPAALAPGDSITCTASYTVLQSDVNSGSVTNIAAGKGHFGGDEVPAGQDTETVSVQEQGPKLNLEKTVSPGTYAKAGDVLTYTYQLTNGGNVTLTGFTVTDDHTSVDCGAAATTLNPGESTSCTATYAVTQQDVDAGFVTNEATAHGAFGATPVDSNLDTATAEADPSAGLSLVKSVDPATYTAVNDVLTYSYQVTNSGSVTLVAPFSVLDDKTTVDCGAAPAGLAPGGSFTCTATYTITQADLDAGSVTNVATAYGYWGQEEQTSNTDSETAVAEVSGPSLALVKTANPTLYDTVGDVITYTYDLTNNGDVTLAAPFSVQDDKTTVTCDAAPASLAPGDSFACTATYLITGDDLLAGSVTNVAQAQGYYANAAVRSNTDTATVVADLVAPTVKIDAANLTTCEVESGEQCITFTVTITGLKVGSVEVLPVAPAVLSGEGPFVFEEDGEYEVTVCGQWEGIPDPTAAVTLELGAQADWTAIETATVGTGSAVIEYNPEDRYTCFPLADLLISDPLCAQDQNGAWLMAVEVQNPNDVAVDFGWSLDGAALQAASVDADASTRLTLLPLGEDYTLAVSWDNEGFAEKDLRLEQSVCVAPTPVPPVPPAPPANVVVIPVTAAQPEPVAEAGVLIPVTGENSLPAGLALITRLAIYLGLGLLGAAFIVQSLFIRK